MSVEVAQYYSVWERVMDTGKYRRVLRTGSWAAARAEVRRLRRVGRDVYCTVVTCEQLTFEDVS